MNTKVNIYACGGAGQNIGRSFLKHLNSTKLDGVEIEVFFADTSRANITEDTPDDRIMLVQKANGSGGLRKTNVPGIDDLIPEILHSYKPGDLNIVLHSAGGGSGGVLGTKLLSELLKRGELAVAFVVGSTTSLNEITNTVKTLQSYDNIAQIRKSPAVVYYRENGLAGRRSEVDNNIFNSIVMLSMFFATSNRELDLEDMRNFILYHRVTSFAPALVNLEFFFNEVNLPRQYRPFTVASLTNKGSDDPGLPFLVSYHPSGFLGENHSKSIGERLPVHAVVLNGAFEEIIERLNGMIEKFQSENAVIRQHRISDTDGGSDGVVVD